jgi:hypothetical protein
MLRERTNGTGGAPGAGARFAEARAKIQHMDRDGLRTEAVHVLRRLRNVALAAARPVDELALTINGKRHYPPIALRRYVGPIRFFETSVVELNAFM